MRTSLACACLLLLVTPQLASGSIVITAAERTLGAQWYQGPLTVVRQLGVGPWDQTLVVPGGMIGQQEFPGASTSQQSNIDATSITANLIGTPLGRTYGNLYVYGSAVATMRVWFTVTAAVSYSMNVSWNATLESRYGHSLMQRFNVGNLVDVGRRVAVMDEWAQSYEWPGGSRTSRSFEQSGILEPGQYQLTLQGGQIQGGSFHFAMTVPGPSVLGMCMVGSVCVRRRRR